MADDVKMTSMARKMIVRNWLDISRLRVRVTRGVIFVSGRIHKLTGGPSEKEGDEPGLRKLDDDLHGVPGMRGVAYQLENWTHETSGGWRKLGQKMTASAKRLQEMDDGGIG